MGHGGVSARRPGQRPHGRHRTSPTPGTTPRSGRGHASPLAARPSRPAGRSLRPGPTASVRGRGWLRPPAAAPPARQAPGRRPGLAGGYEEATEVRPARAPHSRPALTPRPGASSSTSSSSLLSAAARVRALRGGGSSSGLGSGGGGGASGTRTHAARRPRPQVLAPPIRPRFPNLFKGDALQRVGTAEE